MFTAHCLDCQRGLESRQYGLTCCNSSSVIVRLSRWLMSAAICSANRIRAIAENNV